MTRWHVHGERAVYESDWVSLTMVDVELPDGRRFDHHVVRSGADAAGVVVIDRDRGVLLIYRHRFITDTWGWEIPAGRVDEGESVMEAAARETLEETGWRPGELTPMCTFHPMNGVADQAFHLFVTRTAEHAGEPVDRNEAARVEWVAVERVRELVRNGEVRDGMALVGLLWALQYDLDESGESGEL